jgi:hypothetical protein
MLHGAVLLLTRYHSKDNDSPLLVRFQEKGNYLYQCCMDCSHHDSR